MSRDTLDAEATELLQRSIAEHRLSAKPSLEVLNRIAKIIAPVLVGAGEQKKTGGRITARRKEIAAHARNRPKPV